MMAEGALEFCPPPTDRGAEITVGIDWLEFTVRPATFEQMADRLREIVPGDFVETDYGAMGYRLMAVGPGQARLFWSAKARPNEVHVQLKGEWCAAARPLAMFAFVAWVAAHAKATRVDLAADDFMRRVVPADVHAWVLTGKLVSRTRSGRYFYDYATQGETVQIGAFTSRELLRVYDKSKQSDGRIGSVRWELQARDEAASTLVEQLVEMPWGDVWRGRVVRLVDFRERNEGESVSRSPRVRAFADLVGRATRLRAYDPTVVLPVLSKKEQYLKKQIAPTLSAVVAGRRGDLSIVYDMLSEGPDRWRWPHRYLAQGGSDESDGQA